VPTRCPWGAHTCALFLKRQKLRAQTDSLSMIYSPQGRHGRHHRCRIHLSLGLDALGRRMSDFGIFGTQQEFKAGPELWSPRVCLMCSYLNWLKY
jgi:hypothetical protein